MKRHILAVMLVGGLAATPALAQDDGQTAFNNSCRTCHTMKEGDNRQGPSLAGIIGRKDWPTVPVEGFPVPRLQAALAHSVLAVESIADDGVRPRHFCRVVQEETHAPFTGLNRAKAAVLELAILVSRLGMLPSEKIEAEIAYLQIAIEKTAGPEEREAWGWLMQKVTDHLAGDKDARTGRG